MKNNVSMYRNGYTSAVIYPDEMTIRVYRGHDFTPARILFFSREAMRRWLSANGYKLCDGYIPA